MDRRPKFDIHLFDGKPEPPPKFDVLSPSGAVFALARLAARACWAVGVLDVLDRAGSEILSGARVSRSNIAIQL